MLSMKKRYVLFSVLIFWAASCGVALADKQVSRIAHAGGGYTKWQYTNSFEALNSNEDYFSLFEIDLIWTSDEHLVCMHDWEYVAEKMFDTTFEEPPTLAEFERLVTVAPLEPCTLDGLLEWLGSRPGKRLVTDVKHNNLRALSRIQQKLGSRVGDLVIPQIYTPSEYEAARVIGFDDIIWTLYRFEGDADDILRYAAEMELYAVTMPRYMAERGLARKLSAMGISTYVHTINARGEMHYFKELGVDEIYTDWLSDRVPAAAR